MEITKEEVSRMIKEAIEQDRKKRLDESVNQIVDASDIDSPAYNTNRPFNDIRNTYKRKFFNLFNKWDFEYVGPHGEKLNFNPYLIMDNIRQLVLIGFNANSNRNIPINRRREAQKRYEKIAEEVYQMLKKTFE